MYTNDFGDGDYCTLVSLTISEIYSNTGTLNITSDDKTISETITFTSFQYPIEVCE